MICSIIRDLLPLYEEKLCRRETNILVEEHIKECAECKRIYDEMHMDIGLKEIVSIELSQDMKGEEKNHERNDQVFWRKYYGGILLKGIGVFILTYILVVTVGLIIFKNT